MSNAVSRAGDAMGGHRGQAEGWDGPSRAKPCSTGSCASLRVSATFPLQGKIPLKTPKQHRLGRQKLARNEQEEQGWTQENLSSHRARHAGEHCSGKFCRLRRGSFLSAHVKPPPRRQPRSYGTKAALTAPRPSSSTREEEPAAAPLTDGKPQACFVLTRMRCPATNTVRTYTAPVAQGPEWDLSLPPSADPIGGADAPAALPTRGAGMAAWQSTAPGAVGATTGTYWAKRCRERTTNLKTYSKALKVRMSGSQGSPRLAWSTYCVSTEISFLQDGDACGRGSPQPCRAACQALPSRRHCPPCAHRPAPSLPAPTAAAGHPLVGKRGTEVLADVGLQDCVEMLELPVSHQPHDENLGDEQRAWLGVGSRMPTASRVLTAMARAALTPHGGCQSPRTHAQPTGTGRPPRWKAQNRLRARRLQDSQPVCTELTQAPAPEVPQQPP